MYTYIYIYIYIYISADMIHTYAGRVGVRGLKTWSSRARVCVCVCALLAPLKE